MNWSDIPVRIPAAEMARATEQMDVMKLLRGRLGFDALPTPEVEIAPWLVPGCAAPELPSRPKCGGCSLCCYVLEVPDVDTAAWAPCVYQCANGCAIHTSKPAVCKSYGCLWRMGGVKGEEVRPDRLGALYTLRGWVEFGVRYIVAQVNPTPRMDFQRIGAINGALMARGWPLWLSFGDGPSVAIGSNPEDIARVNWMLEREAMAEGRPPR